MRFLRVLVPALVVFGLLFAAVEFGKHDFRGSGPDLADLPDHIGTLWSARQRSDELEAARVKIFERIALGKRICDALIRGDMSLVQAVPSLHNLQPHEYWEHLFAGLHPIVRGSSLEERFCRYIIWRLEVELNDTDQEPGAVLCRLEQEMQDYLQSGVKLITSLPTAPGR
jgi:hypothetical protein